MKRLLLAILAIAILSSCSSTRSIPIPDKIIATSAIPTSTKGSDVTVAAVQATPLLDLPTSAPEQITKFSEPDPGVWVMLTPAVEEYFYYRKKAVVSGNVGVLWERYPSLKENQDLAKGINAEAFVVTSYQSLKVFDGNIFPEHYEPIKVRLSGDQTEVLVHGVELYLWKDEKSNFTNSGGEFKVILFLEQRNDRWEVYKTDEVTLAEWHEFSP